MVNLIVVVEPDYAGQLEGASRHAPVWVVATQSNRDACERLWSADPHRDHREAGAITCFDVTAMEDRFANLINVIPVLETHYGEVKDNELVFPKGFVLEVIGLPLADGVADALREYGFGSFVGTSDGFQACK